MGRIGLVLFLGQAIACSGDMLDGAGSPADVGADAPIEDAAMDIAQDADPSPDTPEDAADDVATDAQEDAAGDAAPDVGGNDADDADEDSGEPDAGADAEPDAEPEGCDGPEDCMGDLGCRGVQGCAEVWACEEVEICTSRSPEAVYCGCNGRTFSLPIACPVPRKWAYRFEMSSPPVGVQCDPGREGPIRFDLVVTGSGFERHSGSNAYLRLQDTVLAVVAIEEVVPIRDGQFEVVWEDIFNTDYFSYFLEMYIDTNGNRTCDPGTDPVWTAFANNTFDFERQRVDVALSPDSDETPELCELW
jgi:hypothetical protein